MPRPWRVPRLQVPQPIKVPSAGLCRRSAYDLVAYTRTRSGIRVEFAFLFGRRLAYLVHLAAQLQIFWPVGDRAHETDHSHPAQPSPSIPQAPVDARRSSEPPRQAPCSYKVGICQVEPESAPTRRRTPRNRRAERLRPRHAISGILVVIGRHLFHDSGIAVDPPARCRYHRPTDV